MVWSVNFLYDGFRKFVQRPQRYHEDGCMIKKLWAPNVNKTLSFQDFLTHKYNNHSSKHIGYLIKDDNTLPYKKNRRALFYPTRNDIAQSTDLSL